MNRHICRQSLLAFAAVLSLPALPGFAKTTSPKPAPPAAATPKAVATTPKAAAPTASAGPKPYAEVITDKAKTQDGLFRVHQIDEKVYWEIPTQELGKEILWVTTLSQTQLGYEDGGGHEVQNRIVRFEKRGDRVLMRAVSYQARPDVEGSMKQSLELDSIEPILMAFDVKAYNDKADNAPVIDVTPLLTGDVAEFSPRQQLGGNARLDPARTFLNRIKALPTNIEVDVLATYTAASAGLQVLPLGPRPSDGPTPDRSTDVVTVVLHHSIVALPAVPMKPRIFDDRIGYFSTNFYEFGSPENQVKEVKYINRLAAGEEGPKGRPQRADQADCVLHRPRSSRQVAALSETSR